MPKSALQLRKTRILKPQLLYTGTESIWKRLHPWSLINALHMWTPFTMQIPTQKERESMSVIDLEDIHIFTGGFKMEQARRI